VFDVPEVIVKLQNTFGLPSSAGIEQTQSLLFASTFCSKNGATSRVQKKEQIIGTHQDSVKCYNVASKYSF
jgi:hypothetical protein